MADQTTSLAQCQALPDAPSLPPTPTPTPTATSVPFAAYNTPVELTEGPETLTTVGTVSVANPVVAFRDPGYTIDELAKPDHGEFVVFTVTATAVSGHSWNISSSDFEVRQTDGTVWDTTYSDGWGPTLPSGNIESGGKVKGTLVFDLPLGAHGSLVYNPNTFGDDAGVAKWKF